ncbi:ATP-dependent DNA helicase RecG [Phreatobacter cathodiphilus]|uniref:Probable DNA 3'-5' helicase RecG n=1 Tax=Phreatobacter cathodiphilus TaxID=1868589 RepID=A0A2S0N9W3_9HYPH|nr:ATP-dependent DNA helicase RecG [Phreatobacter cathodiphilus]AVO44886.1 ATP-dependent DNA helicase RecG [Phreatobacter cathodiphilus]
MRPTRLDPLFARLTTLKGVGAKLEGLYAKLLASEGPPRVVDLLFHLPSGLIDRRSRPTLAEAVPGAIVTLAVLVERHRPAPPGKSRAPYKVLVSDETGDLTLVWFNAHRSRIEQMCPVGETRIVSGRIELFDGMRQMVHPDRVLAPEQAATMPMMEPVYPLTEGLGSGHVRRAAEAALARLPVLPEWLEPRHLAREGWPDFAAALKRMHQPESPEDFAPDGPARSRLAYDELLANQLALGLVRANLKRPAGRRNVGDGSLRERIAGALPFALTGSQTAAIAEIAADMSAPTRMLRLLQGDVGSGKTVVALMAMAAAAEAGRQSALMAPTELLARQHAKTLTPLAAAAGLRVAILTGREKGREREDILAGLASGAIAIVVGTHALFQEHVRFHDLGLAVIDEQHRFGVQQRLALAAKGEAVDLLVMTATPIPRTLVLTYFGDMESSQLREKPAGRKPVDTRVIAMERLGDVVDGIGRALEAGRQVYWVCPLVAEAEEPDENTPDLAAAEERFALLQQRFGAAVDMVHGQMKGTDKDAAMVRFSAGETRLLVATTVIEVGVDVPEASIMVIDHAEHFGLAQLHQLRGRIGRGAAASTCILLYKGPLRETARRRLDIMRETEDGFRIAEEDLTLRGEGDLLGTKQSGMPGFRLARLEHHAPLMETARSDARLIIETDPQLASARGAALRDLLYLFGRNEAIRLIKAG